jgi:8-oxo-dGTP pyrophosphatase MutT (NUDIX family)
MNQELYGKQYSVPPEVLKSLQATLITNPTGEGIKRAKYMLKNGSVTYQELKRLKNFFDYFNPETQNKMQYALAGGDLMKQFIETTLNRDRAAVKTSKEVKQDMNVNPMLGTQSYQTPQLNEDKKKDELKKNALAVIVNEDNKILLLKRSSDSKIWQPNKWGLVGGGIEKNETPKQAVEREIKEETNLDIKKFIKTFDIQRNPDSIEHIFACRYDGNPTDIRLNEENSNYGWYDINEMKFLDIVPHLIEYITISFKEYND